MLGESDCTARLMSDVSCQAREFHEVGVTIWPFLTYFCIMHNSRCSWYSLIVVLLSGLPCAAQNLSRINDHVSPSNVYALAKDKSGRLYASTDNGLYSSMDHGMSWEFIAFPETYIKPLLVDSSGHILASTTKIMLSADTCKSWTNTNVLFTNVISDRHGNLYGAQDYPNALWKSTDGGLSWLVIATLPRIAPTTLAIDTSGKLYFGSWYYNTVHTSTDEGLHWDSHAPYTTPFQYEGIRTLTVTQNGAVIETDELGSSHISRDRGESWTTFYNDQPRFDLNAVLTNNELTEIVFGSTSGIAYSSNAGKSWNRDSLITKGFNCTSLIQDTGQLIHVGTLGRGVCDSYDFGKTWVEHNGGIKLTKSFSFGYCHFDSAWYTGTNDGLYFSTNVGRFWFKRHTGLDARPVKAMVFCSPADVALVSTGDTILRSRDLVHWQSVLSSVQSLQLLWDTVSHMAYAFDSSARWYSSADFGLTWQFNGKAVADGDTLLSAFAENSILIGTAKGLLFRSKTRGADWTTAGSIGSAVTCLGFDSSHSFAGNLKGLFRLDSLGEWEDVTPWKNGAGTSKIIHNRLNQWFFYNTYYGEGYSYCDDRGYEYRNGATSQYHSLKMHDDLLYAIDDVGGFYQSQYGLLSVENNRQTFAYSVKPSVVTQSRCEVIGAPTGSSARMIDILGREVLIARAATDGKLVFNWDATLSEGVYCVELRKGNSILWQGKCLVIN
jgi:photosystem II stability/assembly factor-like uncharacterized protein